MFRMILMLVLLPASVVAGQGVVIAPLALVADSRQPVASLTIINPTTERVEVELSTFFGYPGTDSTGMLYLCTTVDAGVDAPDASEWITFYPRRFVLEPDDRRLVRLRITPPEGRELTSSEYWSRVVVSSRAAAAPIDRATTNPDVRIALAVEVRSVLPLLFRAGPATTGLVIDSITAGRSGDSLLVKPWFRRAGTAAWAGTVRIAVADEGGKVVRRTEAPLGVYFRLAPRMTVPMEGLPAGQYRVSVEGVTQRTDLPASAVLQAPAVRQQLLVSWQGQ
jgi:P pilus assembly chaperone PapD